MLRNGPIPIMANVLEMVRLSIWEEADERLQSVFYLRKKKTLFSKAACLYLKLLAGHTANVTLLHKSLPLLPSLLWQKN